VLGDRYWQDINFTALLIPCSPSSPLLKKMMPLATIAVISKAQDTFRVLLVAADG